jgi:thymidylate synthase (FAD)
VQFIQPQVFHLAQTMLDRSGLANYLTAVGVPAWSTDAVSDAEALQEVMGRTCYNSFAVGLNPNVTRIREGNSLYIKNIIESGHGSVLEHAVDSWVLFNISRVVTHQIVRARVGVGYSQSSGHYIRVDGIKSWFPKVLEDHPRRAELFDFYRTRYEDLEQAQRDLALLLDVDNQSFTLKKKLTTAMRRLVPDGITSVLGFTVNHRQLRFMIEQRTSRANDEEIRVVFSQIYAQASKLYPAVFFDAAVADVEGLPEVTFLNKKV